MHDCKRNLWAVGLVAAFLGGVAVLTAAPKPSAAAEDPAPDRTAADEQAVRRVAEDVAAAWMNQDAKALAAHYAEDAEYINIMGIVVDGPEAIRLRYAEVFTTLLRGSRSSFTIRRVRFPGPGVAMVDVNGIITDLQGPQPGIAVGPGGIVKTRVRHVLVKRDGRWAILATQNTQIAPQARGQE